MSTSVWKGHIAFGMVSFPVKLCAAARSQAVSFHQLHQGDHARVKQVLYCQAEDQPVARTELVKGFEYEKDRYVVLEERDLARAEPRTASVMEVLEFVKAAEVDPVYLDASYYVVPESGGERPYTLLLQAMRQSGYVGIAQATMHQREHLGLLRPGRFGLIVHTLYYHDEVRALDEFRADTAQLPTRELELATLLVDALAASFDAAQYRDTYRENLRALIEAKIRGQELTGQAARPAPAQVLDILEALKASLARARKPVAAPAALAPVPITGENRAVPARRAKRA
jgi:DNA end-binding protein Ku